MILVTHKKKNHLQPPPASRHGSILKLDCVVPLFEIRANTSKNIYEIIISSRGATLPIQKLMTIATDRLSAVEEDPMHVELLVRFYSPAPEDGPNDFEKSEFMVIMPSWKKDGLEGWHLQQLSEAWAADPAAGCDPNHTEAAYINDLQSQHPLFMQFLPKNF
jgi:hypothetical protein